MPHKRRQLVAVITGASSGIGRAIALEFARRGIAVVLASRRKAVLKQVSDECSKFGVPSLVLATDVADENSVQKLASQTFKKFGHLDIWVNDAVLGLYGDFERIPAQDFRRVIETDFFGYVHGARAVLPYFRRQGCGVLINVASVLGEFGIPHMSSYVAAKHAIVGFSDCLRQELRDTGIRVCTVLPYSIDTPFYSNAANYIGHAVRPVPPVLGARTVAVQIAEAIENKRDHVFVPAAAALLPLARSVWPGLTSRIASYLIDRFQIGFEPMPHSPGNLYTPNAKERQIPTGSKEHRRGRAPKWSVIVGAALGVASLVELGLATLVEFRHSSR
jgi:short-subunit dehydrogenase